MRKIKHWLAKLAIKYLEGYIIDIMAGNADEDAKQEAIKAGYTDKDWQEYYLDKQQEPSRESYYAGREDGFEKGYEAGLKG